MKVWQDKIDKSHELEIYKLQMAKEAAGNINQLEEIKVDAQTKEDQEIRISQIINIPWVDALNASVRPIIALSEFALYAAVKLMNYYMNLPWLIWTEDDTAIFAGIIAFYFGSRAFQKR